MRVFLTVDVEQDCPPFRNTYRGITEGLPRLLKLLDDKGVAATFFTTGDVALRHPDSIREIVERGHELGCHGDTHARFDKMTGIAARIEISHATSILRRFYPVTSFRAPNLKLPAECLMHLQALGYKNDSSEARHKNPGIKCGSKGGIVRIPVSTTSLTLRLPRYIRNHILVRLKDPVVLFVHPWEYVDLRKERLRIDCRYKTGDKSLTALSQTIELYKSRGAGFYKIAEFTGVEDTWTSNHSGSAL